MEKFGNKALALKQCLTKEYSSDETLTVSTVVFVAPCVWNTEYLKTHSNKKQEKRKKKKKKKQFAFD